MGKKIEIYHAVDRCIDMNIPFTLYALPGETELHFFADTLSDKTSTLLPDSKLDGFDGFIFNFFGLCDTPRACGIRRMMSATEINKLTPDQLMELDMRLPSARTMIKSKSTPKMHYMAQALNIIRQLKSDDEKTVLSRIKCISGYACPRDVAIAYFRLHPGCFRYLYSTPESGLWLGASPELLLSVDRNSQTVRSMSLAGTRKAGITDQWDTKNQIEHDIVTRFIRKTLSDNGLEVATPQQKTVQFGNLEHLCHIVEAKGTPQLAPLLAALSPTPALCGHPRQQAYRQILDNETHLRYCYGGYVGYSSPEAIHLYANLRCALIAVADNKFIYNLYGGGGLTRMSDYHDEWDETEAKMASLSSLLTEKFNATAVC